MDSPAGWGLPGARVDAPGSARATLTWRGRPAFVAALAAAGAVCGACRGADGPTDTSPVKSVTIAAENTQIFVGATTRLVATLRDADGNAVLDRPPVWLTLAPTILAVTQGGEVTGLQVGTGQIRASSGIAGSEVTIAVRNPIARAVRLSRDTATLTVPGGSVQLFPAVTGDGGQPIANPFITWTSSRPLVATVNVAGLVTAVASGSAVITAAVDGISASMSVTARPPPNAAAPQVTSIIPVPLRPGAIITITGTNFAPTVAGNQVLVDGIPTTVRSASPTQVSVELPSVGFGCEPSRDAFVQVGADGLLGGGTAPLQIANRRTLAPGQLLVVSSAAEVRCNELDPADGRWVVSVYNAARAPVTPGALGAVQFAIRGVVRALTPVGAGNPVASVVLPVPSDARVPESPIARLAARRASVHTGVLERNLDALRNRPAFVRSAPATPSFQLTTMGAISAVKLPNLDAPDFCVSNVPINARTVFVGPHAVILEDTVGQFGGKATLRGQMNDYFIRLGNEFETVMWPILAASFGNPLAMDAQLGGSGRVVMVFSPHVNAMKQGSVVGYVANCDFFPASQRPSSNGGAYFYATVPTSGAAGYANPETRDEWLRAMRATVMHEVKHVTAFAERISRSMPLEDLSWEEGLARIAEEMYAREVYDVPAAAANSMYGPTIGCDIRYAGGTPPCADRPVLMLRHFDGLYGYLGAPENFTPLGRTTAAEFAFYAGAWSVLRWASDHSPGPESQFFRDLTLSGATGVANVEGRTGRSWDDLLGEWSLTMYVDDLIGAGARNPRLFMPSWHLPDVWLGMCTDMGPCANAANPVQAYSRSSPFSQKGRAFGDFVVGVGPMPGGGFTILDFSGPAAITQVLELKSLVGNAGAPPSLRLAIARVR